MEQVTVELTDEKYESEEVAKTMWAHLAKATAFVVFVPNRMDDPEIGTYRIGWIPSLEDADAQPPSRVLT